MKISNLKLKIRRHYFLLIFLIIYFLIICFKLTTHSTPFFDWDESINVQVSKEMIQSKSLIPLWQGKVWLDKPPLPFLFFGSILKLTPFIAPEISLRNISSFLSVISLVLVYAVFFKASNNKLVSLLTVIITSFTPIFLQRSQIVNLDVFLLIGWLGYFLFVQNFWSSFLFLAISVLTKSLIGFYPAAILIIYFLFKKNYKLVKQILIQILILSLWYLGMFIFFGGDFWQQHIVETHFRRVAASIESHFGQRTYYFDLIFEQLGPLMWFSLVGFILVILERLKGVDGKLLYSLFLLPWFIFLNLTKTKIFWYLFPAIPQFAFFSVYPLNLIRKKKILLFIVSCLLLSYVLYINFFKTNFFTTFYSKPEDYYYLSLYAKDRCDSLSILVSKETREATKTLEDLGLTITSTKQWGDHPSMVYYFGKKVNFDYDKNNFKKSLTYLSKNDCLTFRKDDLDLNLESNDFTEIDNFNSYYLYKR